MFSDEDLEHLARMSIDRHKVKAQMELLTRGACYLKLNRPCTISDGILQISEGTMKWLIFEHEAASRLGRLLKFVPASGVASRMFEALFAFSAAEESIAGDDLDRQVKQGDRNAQELLKFIQGIRHFAFFGDLKSVMGHDGHDVDAVIEQGQFKEIIDYLLTPKGLNYAGLPKALLKFHVYPEGSRTAVEEHLVEAMEYVQDNEGICRVQITVSPEHRETLLRYLREVSPRYEDTYRVTFTTEISVQEKRTDTIALDMENRPFREKDGRLLFRPGGHGALIGNLNDLKGDIVYVKNIDNVVPEHLRHTTVIWKKILGGYLISLQKKIFAHLQRLNRGDVDERFIEETLDFARDRLFIVPVQDRGLRSREEKKKFLLAHLNRPLRVCGMVRNQGEPGGGPFWVEAPDGSLSLQIVESAQVDMASPEQRDIWNSATHFNPVDLVCGVRDYRGNPFDLKQFVDNDAVFISRKYKDGRALKALELPGLWNGAMADWITVFVEVPTETFNPVKTINDLLRKEHQP